MISYSAPGNLMLMGEHAILHGQPAIAMAVTGRIIVHLTPRVDRQVMIHSSLGEYQSHLDSLLFDSTFSFIINAVDRYKTALPSGFELRIDSEFSDQVGLGSSAAVTASTVAALLDFSGQPVEQSLLLNHAIEVVRKTQQGGGSGTDLAASIFGGLIAYEMQTQEVRCLNGLPSVDLYYVGYKMKTPDVIALVNQRAESHPDLYASLYQLMGALTRAAEQAISESNWDQLGVLMNQYSGLLDALGVCDRSLADLQFSLRTQSSVKGAKISGSGLGDSVITLGLANPEEINYQHLPITISPRGLEKVC